MNRCALVLLIVVLASCSQDKKSEEAVNPEDALARNVDTTLNPADNFFLFANGGWIKQNAIPEEQSSWGIGNLVIEENLSRLRKISEAAAASNAAKGTSDQKIGDFWLTAMDSAKIEQQGITPLKPYLDKIDAINDINSLVATSAELKKIGSGTMFADFVTQDAMNTEVMTYELWQAGLGLPEREYYFKTDSTSVAIRDKYKEYITNILTLSGDDHDKAAKAADDILAMETKLAGASRKLVDLRDPYANYNKMAVGDLPKLAPAIDWKRYLEITEVKNLDSLIVGQPEFFKALNDVLKTTPIDVWKSELKFNLVSDFSSALPDTFRAENFKFNSLFSGAKVQKPRWKLVMGAMEGSMGELLGQLYVKEYFNEKTKQRYSDLVTSIKEALRNRISQLDWMSDSTKQKAYAKLDSMKKKVGYPDKWKDFSAMEIGRDSYVQNKINANKWWHQHEINKLGKPVDRDEWDMTPQTYNAYYNPYNNEIVLPAGIFTVPGYRDEELDDATVYGYAGASTIGHEITHGFDDEGRQFDAQGNLKSWWTKTDEEEFNRRAQVMVEQFDAFEPLPGYHINGKATLGENIADLGGILLGLDAYKKTAEFKEGKMKAGYTPLQRYFLGYSLGWLGHMREESLRNRLLTDVHSPAEYRVNGPFVDVDEFYNAFDIKPGSPMYRADSLRVKIW